MDDEQRTRDNPLDTGEPFEEEVAQQATVGAGHPVGGQTHAQVAVPSMFERQGSGLVDGSDDEAVPQDSLSRGTALLRNLDRLITQEIGISCYIADNPLECVAIGAGIALDHLDLIKRSTPLEGEWLVSF